MYVELEAVLAVFEKSGCEEYGHCDNRYREYHSEHNRKLQDNGPVVFDFLDNSLHLYTYK